MKNLKNLFVLSFAIIAFSAAGLSAAAPSGQEAQEKTLEQQIFKQILTMPYYEVFDSIGFEVDGDTVTLTGKVYNALNRRTAEKRVAKLDGISKVINNIEILPPSRFDDGIRRSTVRAFTNTGGIYRYLIGPNPSVRIIVDRGHLTLEGNVASKSDIKLMNILAQGVPGAFSVTNNLQVSDGKKY